MSQKQYAYFSAAIRDGAKLRPQAFGGFYGDSGTCAVGAGLEACEIAFQGSCLIPQGVYRAFPYLASSNCGCPVETCPDEKMRVPEWHAIGVMAHLNDVHQWTREAIADWLYLEEEKLGFITVIDTEAHNEPANTWDNNLALEECFVPALNKK